MTEEASFLAVRIWLSPVTQR